MRERRFECGAACVRIHAGGTEFALSAGNLSLLLDRQSAQDVVAALTYALLATVPHQKIATPTRKPRARTARATKREQP